MESFNRYYFEIVFFTCLQANSKKPQAITLTFFLIRLLLSENSLKKGRF